MIFDPVDDLGTVATAGRCERRSSKGEAMAFETSFDILDVHCSIMTGPAEKRPARVLRHCILRPPSTR